MPDESLDAMLSLPTATARAAASTRALGVDGDICLPLALDKFTVYLIGPLQHRRNFVRSLLGVSAFGVILAESIDAPGPIEYNYGSTLSVQVHAPHDERPIWEQCIALTNSRSASLASVPAARNRAVIELPSSFLKNWGLRLVELPSSQPQLDAVSTPSSIAILLLCSTDELAAYGQRLSAQIASASAAVCLIPLDINELSPQSALISLTELNAPLSTAKLFRVPIALEHLASSSRVEQKVLNSIFAFMRATQSEKELPSVEKALARQRETLLMQLQEGLSGILNLARGSMRDRLRAVTGLFRLKQRMNSYRNAFLNLEEVARLVQSIYRRPFTKYFEMLHQWSQVMVAEYNVEAGCRSSVSFISSSSAVDSDFAQDLVRMREILFGFINNISSEAAELGIMPSEIEQLFLAGQEFLDGRTRIVFFGAFSAGKSSLINALLGTKDLLPTGITATTAMMTSVEHADSKCIINIDWHQELELPFLTRPGSFTSQPTSFSGHDNPIMLQVHREEIRALLAWISSGEVRWQDCTMQLLDQSEAAFPPEELFRNLLRSLGLDLANVNLPAAEGVRIPKHIYRSDKTPVPRMAQVIRFCKSPEWATEQSVEAFLRHARQSTNALRIRMLSIGYPNQLLRHAVFVDTPGTNSATAYHGERTRQFVEDQYCPIVYCMFSGKAFREEDRLNIRQLLQVGLYKHKHDRAFFVITMKTKINPEHWESVREFVRRGLMEEGFPNPKLYLIDVHSEREPEFQRFKRDLALFLESRSLSWQPWAAFLKDLLTTSRTRTSERLANLGLRDDERKRKREYFAEMIRLGEAAFTEWTHPARGGEVRWLHALKAKLSLLQDWLPIEEQVESLREPSDFDDLRKYIESNIDDLDNGLRVCLGSVMRESAKELRKLWLKELSIKQLPLPDFLPIGRLFSGAKVMACLDAVHWPPPSWKDFFRSNKKTVARNRELVLAAWRQARHESEQLCEDYLKRWIRGLVMGIKAQLESFRRSHHDLLTDESASQIRAQLDRAQTGAIRWLGRLESLHYRYGYTGKRAPYERT